MSYILMGMNQLFTGSEHVLFLCALIFALMDCKNMVNALVGFMIGHSVSLILSTINVIHVSGRLADTGIALALLYVGIENVVRKEPPRNSWWLVTAFGLVNGLGFSSAIRETGLPKQSLALHLLAFNLGIEFAQIVLVAAVYPILLRLRWYKETMNEKDGARQFAVLMRYCSAFTACIGCFWLIQRILIP